MPELIAIIAAAVFFARLAPAHNKSGVTWGAIALTLAR